MPSSSTPTHPASTRQAQRLAGLSARLIAAQEQERGRIARELHDEIGQALVAIRIYLTDAQRAPQAAGPRLQECVGVVDGAIAQIRQLALSLRPTMLDDLGLADAIGWQLDQHRAAAGWQGRVQSDELEDGIAPDVKTACFRIAQEAIDNAARHARATRLDVSLARRDGWLELVVADNGVGFDLERYRSPQEAGEHFGVFTMEERAALVGGRLRIETAAGRGTRVLAQFPLGERP